MTHRSAWAAVIGEVGARGLTAASGVSWFEQCRSKMESVAFAAVV